MADISSKLDKIKSAERGEDVRDAIIGALRDINNDVPADMSNPERVTADMPGGSDLTIPFNPPKLVSEIYVRQAGSGGKSTTLKDITITENGEYPTDEDDYDPSTENRYYKKVKVDVPQLANKIEMDEVVIEQNGTYSATEWGVDGLRTITVNVQAAAGEGPFTVEFYSKPVSDPTSALIHTELVAKNGSVTFTALDGTTNGQGQWFKGWSPDPVNVTRDLKCYPVYSDIVIDPTEISDTWDQICANGGAPYPIGAHKSLYVEVPAQDWNYTNPDLIENCPFYMDGTTKLYPRGIYQTINIATTGFLLDMIKVAQGESGSTSTWLSRRRAYANVSDADRALFIGSGDGSDNRAPAWYKHPDSSILPRKRQDWGNSSIRAYLNEYFFKCMSPMMQATIKPVSKTYYGAMSYDQTWPQAAFKQSSDRIWIPSMAEFKTWLNSYPHNQGYPTTLSKFEELLSLEQGVDYTTDYETLGLDFGWDVDNPATNFRDYCNTFYNVSSGPSGYTFSSRTLNNVKTISISSALRCLYFFIGFCL